MVAACFPIMKRDDWQQRDGAGVEGTWLQFIWSENIFFVHLSNKTQTNSSDYLFESWPKTSYPILYVTFFQLPSSLYWEKRL